MLDDSIEDLFGVLHSFLIGAVQDVNKGISVLVIVMPELDDLGLSPNIPDSEGKVLILDLFYIETDSWHSSDSLLEFHLVEDGSFTCSVEA